MRLIACGFLMSVAVVSHAEVTATIALPELAWGTNVATITLRNDATARTVTININARNEDVGGVGWDTEHALAANQTSTIARDFYIRPLPGRVFVDVKVAADGATILERRYNDRFRAGEATMNPVHASSARIWPAAPADYPALEAIVRPPFVFYVMPADSYAKKHLHALWRERLVALHRLNAKLGTKQCEPIAFYLFPDAATKFAYMFHRGLGWAVGEHAIVEIFNAHEHLDPNHELAHIISAPLGEPPALFNEGLAVYLQTGSTWDGRAVDDWTRRFAGEKRLVPIDTLLGYTDIGSEGTHPEVTYPEAGSFVKFLDRRYGMRAVLRAFGALKSSDDPLWQQENARKFAAIFGATPVAVEREWLRLLTASKK